MEEYIQVLCELNVLWMDIFFIIDSDLKMVDKNNDVGSSFVFIDINLILELVR